MKNIKNSLIICENLLVWEIFMIFVHYLSLMCHKMVYHECFLCTLDTLC